MMLIKVMVNPNPELNPVKLTGFNSGFGLTITLINRSTIIKKRHFKFIS